MSRDEHEAPRMRSLIDATHPLLTVPSAVLLPPSDSLRSASGPGKKRKKKKNNISQKSSAREIARESTRPKNYTMP